MFVVAVSDIAWTTIEVTLSCLMFQLHIFYALFLSPTYVKSVYISLALFHLIYSFMYVKISSNNNFKFETRTTVYLSGSRAAHLWLSKGQIAQISIINKTECKEHDLLTNLSV